MSRRGENIFKRGDGRWEGRYISGYENNGKARYMSVYAHSYVECSRKLQFARSNLLPKSIRITVNELFAAWLESRRNSVKQSTYAEYKFLFHNYISSDFGETQADRMTSLVINSYISKLLICGGNNGKGLSPTSVQAIMIILKSVFTYGETEFGLKNPAKNVSMPKSEYKETEVFTNSEMEKIRENSLCRDCSKLGILLCLYTGLRIGEICALKWSDIDLANQVIHVRKTLQRIKNPDDIVPKTVIIIDEPKSSKSVRDIPVPTFMMPILTEIGRDVDPQDYFITCAQRFIEPRTYQFRFKSFLKSIDVPYKNFHVLRHTFATECIRLGVDVKTVSELLGHASVKITLERYVHSDMDMKRKQLEKLYAFK